MTVRPCAVGSEIIRGPVARGHRVTYANDPAAEMLGRAALPPPGPHREYVPGSTG